MEAEICLRREEGRLINVLEVMSQLDRGDLCIDEREENNMR